MSAFIATYSTSGLIGRQIDVGINKNNEAVQAATYRASEPDTLMGRMQDVDMLWTRSSFSQMYSDSNKASPEDCMGQRWEWNWPPTGGHYPKVVTGIVKDSSGTPVTGAVVQLFNTATGLLVDTSAATGSDGVYKVGDPNAVASFAVGYKTGAPDTEGGTVNTVTGV